MSQQGPLTRDQLLALWRAAVDPSYGDPIVAAGDGYGLEVYDQFFVALARVSQAADTTTQACYLFPHSSQTAPEAQGPQNATVTITVTRTGHLEKPLVMVAGLFGFQEQQNDYSPTGSTPILTGRIYLVAETTIFAPGEMGPIDVPCVAVAPGWGFNNPLPGSISVPIQEGSNLTNIDASVSLSTPAVIANPSIQNGAVVTGVDEPDVFIPAHVGQYVELTAGANIGLVGRVVVYYPPNLGVYPPTGGGVLLADSASFELTPVSGTLQQSEPVTFTSLGSTVGYGVILGIHEVDGFTRAVVDVISGVLGDTVVGSLSGGVASIDSVSYHPAFTAESLSATWRVLDWVLDFGMVALNLAQPSGGRLGFLDELGAERGMQRAPAEPDEVYRERIGTQLDNITPNAMIRAINRALVPFGETGCLREVGRVGLPGFFYDAGSSTDPHPNPDNNYAYDMDFTARPADRYKLYMSFKEFRAFFLVALPTLTLGEFGFPFDGADSDATPFLNPWDVGGAYDGYPLGASPVYQSLWAAISSKKAAGVGFDFVPDNGPCP